MPTKCDECGEEVYAIHVTRNYSRLCSKCYDEVRPNKKWDPDDLTPIERIH